MALVRGKGARIRSAKSSLRASNLPTANGRRRRPKKTEPPFKLLELPPEIVGNICDHVDDFDLVRMRLVCRALSAHSIPAFGQRSFTHLVAILHPSSLTILMEISRHPEFSKYVRKLTVSGERVGHLIQFDEDAMEPHVQLQASMTRSGMDKLMLANVFQKLSNLAVVRVDNLSYHMEPKGLRCGIQYIVPEGTEWSSESDDHGQCRFNPAFEAVFESIKKASNCDTFDWELDVYVSEQEEECLGDWFGPKFPDWQERFARNVRKLNYSGSELLPYVTGLEELMCGFRETTTFTDPAGRMFVWPRLCSLEVNDTEMMQYHLVDFLQGHQATLNHMFLNGTEIRSGTWKAVFEVMTDMPQLRSLKLWAVLEDTSLPHQCGTCPNGLEDASEDSCEELFATGHGVSIALHALTSRFLLRLVPVLFWFQYRIDYRIANAAVDGVAQNVDGEWLLKG